MKYQNGTRPQQLQKTYALNIVLVRVVPLLTEDSAPDKFARFIFNREAKIIFSISLKIYYLSFALKA